MTDFRNCSPIVSMDSVQNITFVLPLGWDDVIFVTVSKQFPKRPPKGILPPQVCRTEVVVKNFLERNLKTLSTAKLNYPPNKGAFRSSASSARSGALRNLKEAHCNGEQKSLGKVSKTLMTSFNSSHKTPRFAFILLVFIVLVFQTTAFARRHSSNSNRRSARAEKGRRSASRERGSSRRG